MKKLYLKRVLALCAAACLLVTALSGTAAAAESVAKIGEDTYTSMDDAIKAAYNMAGEVTIDVLHDAEVTLGTVELFGSPMMITSNFVVNLNGYKLSVTGYLPVIYGDTMRIVGDGILEFAKNGAAIRTQGNQSALTLDGVTLISNSDSCVLQTTGDDTVAIHGGSVTNYGSGAVISVGFNSTVVTLTDGSYSGEILKVRGTPSITKSAGVPIKEPEGYYWKDDMTLIKGAPEVPETGYHLIYADGDADGGTVPVDANQYLTNSAVTVLGNTGNLTRDGYRFVGWGYNGNVYQPGDVLSMPGSDVTLTARWEQEPLGVPIWILDAFPFADAVGHWAEDAIRYVWYYGWMGGTSADAFSPDAATSRGMLMTVLARISGVNTAGAVWYEAGLNWAVSQGISDGSDPNGTITREQLVTMLYRRAGSPALQGDLSRFADASSVSAYARDAMSWAVAQGLISGIGDRLEPQGATTRAQLATILMRLG